jgi:hypothetical protein
MKTEVKIDTVMTTEPHTIGKSLSIVNAVQLMNKYQVRHLPVLDHGTLVGVLSDQDLSDLRFDHHGQSLDKLKVEDVMMAEPYIVRPHTPLGDVTRDMSEQNLPCAVICHENRKVIGIFTAVDALRVLHNTLKRKEKAPRSRTGGKR